MKYKWICICMNVCILFRKTHRKIKFTKNCDGFFLGCATHTHTHTHADTTCELWWRWVYQLIREKEKKSHSSAVRCIKYIYCEDHMDINNKKNYTQWIFYIWDPNTHNTEQRQRQQKETSKQ